MQAQCGINILLEKDERQQCTEGTDHTTPFSRSYAVCVFSLSLIGSSLRGEEAHSKGQHDKNECTDGALYS